ncbi:hypothetical protein Rhopal_000303-T1 [Rhodotorula paludigena]|uniref:Protein kinase domain-containing protein n=1 Tax=Rhodotorula paludigena TaxID=86838 RepID=A0AAV5GA95_9BASI|nr:hypothetical protein Rhopal_000303-T1 [Rhodotorula paludigena]
MAAPRPPRPTLERSAATSQGIPSPARQPSGSRAAAGGAGGLSRSTRLDSLSALAAKAGSSTHTSPGSASLSLPPSPPTWSGSSAPASSRAPSPSPTPPSSLASPTSPAPPAMSAALSPTASKSPPPSVHSTSTASSGRTNAGFVVTSRPKYYQPPPGSPGPPAIMAKNPFYRSTPPGSRDNSRDNSRNNSRNNSRDNSPSRASRLRSYPPTAPFPPPVPSTSTATGIAAVAAAALVPAAALPSLLPLRRGSSPAALPTFDAIRDVGGTASGHASGSETPSGAVAQQPEPKTTRTLSSSIDSKGRRMVNQYVRLKTIGQGSHGKVWLCAEPSSIDEEEELDQEGEEVLADVPEQGGAVPPDGRAARRRRRTPSERWEADIDAGRVRYCAIKSVARDGPGGQRGQRSLRLAAQQKGRKQSSQGSGGIGADDKVKREVAIMKRLDHPNIVRLKEVIDDSKSKKVFMVLEFMAGGQVVWQDDNKQPTMTVDEARRTFRDVVLGLEYLHFQGIIHRDIKPANLLWTEDHSTVKISDFGVSHVSEALIRASPDDDETNCENDDKALRKTAGSPAFFAPELCFPAEFTPTPNAHPGGSHATTRDTVSASREHDSETYFSPGLGGSTLTPTSSGAIFSSPTSPNGLSLSSHLISLPLPPPSPDHPRTRPPVGKGIDIWALGVTLYCLLFGDTPFTARTEYELYNVIVREPIRVPERMGREGMWTGVGRVWEGCGDGAEGREVVDLLGRLLEKDPTKRITLEEVKTHPWVLRNLDNPTSWLHDTDLAQVTHVTITDEDVQCATQERSGALDALPPIRNRPGIRRALNAALAKFPAFSRIKSTRTNASTNSEDPLSGGVGDDEPRSRSKSNSSAGHGAPDEVLSASGSVSRQPSDSSRDPGGAPFERRGKSKEGVFGVDLRRIISGSGAHDGGANHGTRGGWGNRTTLRKATTLEPPSGSSTPGISGGPSTPFPELSRSVSSSSVVANPETRSRIAHHFFQRKASDDTPGARSNASSGPSPSPATSRSGFSPSPFTGSDTESNPGGGRSSGRGGFSRVLSRFNSGSGPSAASSLRSRSGARQFSGSTDGGSDDVHRAPSSLGIAQHVVDQLEAAGTTREQFDSLGRLVVSRKGSGASAHTRGSAASGFNAAKAELDAADDEDDVGPIDLTEFEYSDSDDVDDDDDDDDDLDDFLQQPLAHGTQMSGWNYPAFPADFRMDVRSSDDHGIAREGQQQGVYVSPSGTPPTDELDPLGEEEEDGKVGPVSTASAAAASRPVKEDTTNYVPYADAVSFQLCPLDLDFDSFASSFAPLSIPTEQQQQTPRGAPSFAHQMQQNARLQPESSSSSARDRSYSPRDGSIRGVSLDPPGPRKTSGVVWGGDDEDDGDDGEEEILVVPRRRRAPTLSGSGNGTPTGSGSR